MFGFFKQPRNAIRVFGVLLAILTVSGCSSKEERAKSYYEHGTKLLAEHENAKASIEFKNAVKLKKNYAAAWLALAKIEELNGNIAGEVPYLRNVVELEPTDIDAKLKLAKILLRGRATDDALKLINAAYDLDNHNADILALKAAILLQHKEVSGALEDAHAALELDPKNATALAVLAADRVTNGETQAALQLLDKAETDTDDNNVGIELSKLRIFEQTKDWPHAEALLKKLIERHPDGPYRAQLIRLYLVEKRPDDAENELRALVAARPNDPAPELALVRLLNAFKGPTVARQELVDRIKVGKDVFPYQVTLAQFDFGQGRFNDSEALLKGLIAGSTEKDAFTAQITLAQMYLSRKQLDAAESLVSQILQKDSRNTSGLALRASIHIERGQFEGAINDLREALNDQPRSTPLMLLLATAYERSGAIELAEKQLSEAMRVSNFNPAVSLNYVAFLQRRGSIPRAEEVLTDLAGRWPQNIQILSKLADVKLARQDWSGAEAVAERIKRTGGNSGVADDILGTALLGEHKYDQALDALQGAYAAAPSSPQTMLALVEGYLRTKQIDKAVTLLQSVLKADPANAQAYVLLGSIQQQTNAPKQALESFKMAIEKQPKSPAGYQALANFYLAQKNIGEAQDVVHAGLKQLPDNPSLHLILAAIEELNGDYDAAISEYELLLSKDTGSLVVANNLASLLADHRTDKASLERAQSLAASLRKSPVPQFKDTLGWISYQNGNYKDAISLLEEAAAALPNRAEIHYHLGMSYIATGQLDKASEQLNAALNKANSDDTKAKIQAALKTIASKQ